MSMIEWFVKATERQMTTDFHHDTRERCLFIVHETIVFCRSSEKSKDASFCSTWKSQRTRGEEENLVRWVRIKQQKKYSVDDEKCRSSCF